MKKTVMPKSLAECMIVDEYAEIIWKWSETLKDLAKKFFYALLVIGFFVSLGSSYVAPDYYYNYNATFQGGVFFASLISWIIYAVLEYFSAYAISLLLGSLATIVQNTKINASVALYKANCELKEIVETEETQEPKTEE